MPRQKKLAPTTTTAATPAPAPYEPDQVVIFTTPGRGGSTPERPGTYRGTLPAVGGKGGGSFHIIRDAKTGHDVKARPGCVRAA